MSAARELYAVQGIDETSVAAIAERAGLSIGALYSHFSSKEGLVLQVVDDAMTDLEHRLRKARDLDIPIERVLAAGETYLRFSIEHPALARYLAARAVAPPDDHRGSRSKLIDRRVRAALLDTASDLRRAMDQGQVPRMPIDALMVTLWGLCAGIADLVSRSDALAVTPELACRALSLGTGLMLPSRSPGR